TVRAKAREYDATRANEITAGLRPNPTMSYSAEQLGNGAVDSQHTVVLAQPIETGGKRRRRVESARAASRVTPFELDDVRRQVGGEGPGEGGLHGCPGRPDDGGGGGREPGHTRRGGAAEPSARGERRHLQPRAPAHPDPAVRLRARPRRRRAGGAGGENHTAL